MCFLPPRTARPDSGQGDENEQNRVLDSFSIGHDHERRRSVAVKRAPRVYSYFILLDHQGMRGLFVLAFVRECSITPLVPP
jgi:hypothetical protein